MKRAIPNQILTHIQQNYESLNNLSLLQCIRESLIMVVPTMMIGAFALVFRSFPYMPYQTFIHAFAGGALYSLFDFLYTATFGVLSIYMTVALSMAYNTRCNKHNGGLSYGPVLTSLLCFFLLSGLFTDPAIDRSVLGMYGIFTALVGALCSCSLYFWFQTHLNVRIRFYTFGADENFHTMFRNLFPMILTTLACILFHLTLKLFFHVDSFQTLYVSLLNGLFQHLGCNLKSAILLEMIIHGLWFFGIHGSNVMEIASQTTFEPPLTHNMELVAQGLPPTEIFNQTFFNVFVLIGGCGTSLALIFAILLFSKKNSIRSLAGIALFPGLFNVNELMLFGLPIAFNPVFLIPFFLTPLINLCISSFAMYAGLVPLVSRQVEWTTPILFGGYYATGSIAGSILQLVNLIIGIAIYRPFVLLQDKEQQRNSQQKMSQLVTILEESEQTRIPVQLLDIKGLSGMVAKVIADELRQMLRKGTPLVYYQPQYDQSGHCIGAESLFRWKHPVYGMLYPPLVLKLAEEDGTLLHLEEIIFETVIRDMDRLRSLFGEKTKISINVTGSTIQLDAYEQFLLTMHDTYPQYTDNICIEITEQAAFQIDEAFLRRLKRIASLGYRLAIDDFSMGNTSIKYLQSSSFSLIKLDGTLSRNILSNPNSQGIVASIADMSKNFHISLLAEYVENEAQQKKLEELGCYLYQGYLYSPALSLETLEAQLTKG